MKHLTVIFSNAGDEDCQTLRRLWDGVEKENLTLVEVTADMDAKTARPLVDAALESEDDTVIFCGHGSTEGLFSPSFDCYLFDKDNLPKLKAGNVLAIWCHADGFWDKFDYEVLTSSMYISNVGEAAWNGIAVDSQDYVNETNTNTFTEMNRYLLEGVPFSEWSWKLLESLDRTNPVDSFNRKGMTYLVCD